MVGPLSGEIKFPHPVVCFGLTNPTVGPMKSCNCSEETSGHVAAVLMKAGAVLSSGGYTSIKSRPVCDSGQAL